MCRVKNAKPDRYQVDRVGTPDPPTTEYYVLDIVNDVEARVALAWLGTRYARAGQKVRADEAHQALHDTQEAHRAVMEARNPKQKKATKKEQRVIPA